MLSASVASDSVFKISPFSFINILCLMHNLSESKGFTAFQNILLSSLLNDVGSVSGWVHVWRVCHGSKFGRGWRGSLNVRRGSRKIPWLVAWVHKILAWVKKMACVKIKWSESKHHNFKVKINNLEIFMV